MSTIKVDTIQKANGTSQIGIDKIGGVTSASIVNVIAEGGTNTTNLAQGLAKAWAHIAAGGASLSDSFNCSGIDDDGTGEYGLNFTTALGSANYSAQATITFNNSGSNNLRTATVESKATGAVELDFAYTNSSAVAIAYDVETDASAVIYGDLA